MECRNVARVKPATDILVCDSHGGWSHICLYQPHPTMHAWPPSSKQANSKENKGSQPHEGVASAHQVAEALPPREALHLLARLERQAVHDIAIVTACRQHKPRLLQQHSAPV